jgi:hypothetical protein
VTFEMRRTSTGTLCANGSSCIGKERPDKPALGVGNPVLYSQIVLGDPHSSASN